MKYSYQKAMEIRKYKKEMLKEEQNKLREIERQYHIFRKTKLKDLSEKYKEDKYLLYALYLYLFIEDCDNDAYLLFEAVFKDLTPEEKNKVFKIYKNLPDSLVREKEYVK